MLVYVWQSYGNIDVYSLESEKFHKKLEETYLFLEQSQTVPDLNELIVWAIREANFQNDAIEKFVCTTVIN